jgi:hypothetical protein
MVVVHPLNLSAPPTAVRYWHAVCSAYPCRAVEADSALAGHPGRGKARTDVLKTLGAALYRAGQFEEAIRRLDQSIRTRGDGGDPRGFAFLALAHYLAWDTATRPNAGWTNSWPPGPRKDLIFRWMTWRFASCTARPNRLSWEAVPQLPRSPPPHQPRGLERSAGSRSDSARQQHRLSQDYRYIIPQSALAVIREPSRSEARSRPGRAAATWGISPRMAGRWRWLPTSARARPRPGDWNSPYRAARQSAVPRRGWHGQSVGRRVVRPLAAIPGTRRSWP